MKIGLNGQKLLIEYPAGPEKYTYNIFHALSKIDQENKYTIYFDKNPDEKYFQTLVNNNSNFTYKVVENKISWTQVALAKELLDFPVDAFFTAVHTIPVVRNSPTKIIAMIHGLEYLTNEEIKNPIKKALLGKTEKFVCKNADEIIVPSAATRNAILNQKWGFVSEDKINIIYEGVSENFKKRPLKEIRKVKDKYSIDDQYIIAVSTIQPRKNYIRMIEGFSLTLKQNRFLDNYKLIIAGKKGWEYEEVYAAPKKYGVENKVKFVGRVPDEDLPPLYSGASAYISTSMEEGFGLPLIEAMACEIATIASDIPAYREVGQSYPIFVNPKEAESIKQGIVKALTNKPNRASIKKAKSLVNTYTWEKSADKLLRIIKNA